jgi:hypothetical protein
MIKTGAVAKGVLNIGLTAMLLTCAAVILASAFLQWLVVLRKSRGAAQAGVEVGV